MTQPSLNEEKQAQLGELLEAAREVEEKLREFGEISAAVAEKWQRKAETKRALGGRKV